MHIETKAAVTVAEMARMIGMSRARLYQLMGKAFPKPKRDESGRPYFDEEQQQTILEVRRRNCGIDGKPILFYAPRNTISTTPVKRRTKPKPVIVQSYPEVADGIRGLGLVVTDAQVTAAVSEAYPDGIDGTDLGEVIRNVFLSIQRNN